MRFEEIVGILTICSKQANAFDIAEVELLKELAETLSHGLMSLRARSLLKQTNERLQKEMSDRQHTEAALRESYNLLHTVIDTTPDAVFVKNLEGCYLLMNLPGASLFNKLPEEIIGQDDTDLFPPEVAAQIQANDRILIESHSCQIIEEALIIQGEERTYLSSKTSYRDSEGNVLGLVCFAKDITSLKLTQKALRQANEELEEGVLSRTAELSQANAELVRSNTELEQFAYIASHDLREPLRKIKSYAELLAETYQGQLDDTASKLIPSKFFL
jgi:PAS domain S-box-containing protein